MGFFAAIGATSCGHCPEHQSRKGFELPKPPNLEEEKKYFVSQVERSGELGPDLKPLVQETADALFEKTFGKPSPAMERPAPTTCFQQGCLYQVIYRDRCALAAFVRRFYSAGGAPLRHWPGAIYQSAAFDRKDGRVEVTWALLITDPKGQRQRLQEAVKASDVQPPVVVPDRCAASDVPPTQSSAPPEVK